MKEKKSFFIKLCLVLLGLSTVVIASFCDAKTVSNKDTGMDDLFGFNRQYKNGYWDISPSTPGTITCAFLNTNNNGGTFNDGTNSYPLQGYASYCTDSTTVSITTNSNYEVFVITVGEDMKEQFFPQYTSLQCQTAYSLIPVSSVTANYCKTNFGLIDPSECTGGDTPSGGSLTDLYINNILHVGAPTIIMNIPEEIDWDYAYTQGGNTMNIDIVGYNVDYDKMQEVIDVQNFKPSSEDLSNVITNVIPLFVPGLCIILLLYFIFKFIKKVF